MSETGDGLDDLRIPYEKIKFGKKLETQGYGTVYEGEFDNQRVALKQLNITNLANIKPKLLAEILTISRFSQHPNLVELLGFCDEKSNEITLVYEYVTSGNLEDKMRKRLTTIQRFEICLGAARGLCYLHSGVESITIVHGNIKLSKILLNSDASSSKFTAKVSSFGLSKIVPGKGQKVLESSDEDIEKPTEKSDVYSFGVLLLIVLCGVSELVDTDDYQEHHVSELVPKKMKQNKLRNTVHRDIRKEIKTEALETYAAIACQCVMDNPDDRPDMAKVVEELEKALRLQGGEVTYVQIPGSGAIDEAGKEPEKQNIQAIEEHVKVDDASEKNTVEVTNTESVLDTDHIEDAKNENSNDDPATKNEMLNDSNSTKESNITVENEEEAKSKVAITIDRETTEITTTSESSNGDTSTSTNQESVPDKNDIDDAKNENSNNNPATQKEILKDSSFIKESNITVENEMSKIDKEISEENKEDKESMKMTTTLESSNGGTSTSTSKEVHESKILMPDSGSFSEVNEDELERLRIPFGEIKFGQKIDVRGYGTMFEGEYNHQQVALKRLNITNLQNIKPKLLSAILTIYRFRQHPNLVAIIGFCDESNKELILVYEYVSGGNLADMMSKHLTTIQRHQICLGAARGLEYLHSCDESVNSNPCIIHGNLKFSKILLNCDSVSSNYEAKVSGFGLPKLLPGDVEIGPKFTGKLTKESDVYTFGVLLLEVLCGVPELVDTDDYQKWHVTELVPKRLEQNMLRKIVHFDIRDEITTESLETYAKIACRCVRENPEERPTMSEVVVELEKALRLQGGKVSEVKTFGSSNGNTVPEVPVGEDDHKGDGNGEMTSITEKESKGIEETIDDINLVMQVEESFPVPISGSNDVESVPEDAETKNGNNMNDPESTKEIKTNLNSNEEESNIIGENEVDNESKITTSSSKSDNGDDSTLAMGEKVSNVQLLASSNGNSLYEEPVGEDDLDNDKTMSSNIKEKESKVIEETTDDTALESVPDKNHTEDAKNESSNNDPTTQKEILNALNFIEESNITDENEKENKRKISINDGDNEMSTIDQETTKEITDDFDSNNESKIIKENKEDDEILKITTIPESSNGDTSTSTSQVSDRGSFSEVNEDELERLRIPFEEIKFGQKIDVRGYGTMFEGEYNHQQVALKRLNITNLHNIKPKLLSAILTIYRFRQHPNLVAIIGFCDESNKELILVYEYVSGGNLADMMSKHLTTIQRHQICLGAARGLEYLHSGDESVNSNPCIIHGNLKLSKILLNYDSVSSNFEAKVSGFGLPKLLPGHVEIGPKSTGKLTKESDVYTFGVLLLEVLCGVPELVDTDDYQERHVTELVPKRLEQNLLRKIVHFDIRDEIATESLETYAKIACRCVRKNPDERPTMPEVVVELEKALRLQGGKVSDVQIFGSSNGNVVPEVPIGEHDHKGEDNGETTSITEKESKGIEETIDDINLEEKSFPIPISGSNDVESVPEDVETKNGNNKNDPESTEQIKINLTSNEEKSNIIGENEVENESKITTMSSKSDCGDDRNPAMSEKVSDVQMLASNNGNNLNEVIVGEDALDNDETMSSNITEKASKLIEETIHDTALQEPLPDETSATKVKGNGLMMNSRSPHTEQIMEVQKSAIPDGKEKAGSLNTGTTDLIVNIGEDFSNSATQTQISESRRSNSTCSQSSNGDDTTPSDYLLPKSPDNVKKTSRGSGNCCYCFCSCSWLRFISDRVVLYGGLFWNKLISCFTWMTGQCSSKRD